MIILLYLDNQYVGCCIYGRFSILLNPLVCISLVTTSYSVPKSLSILKVFCRAVSPSCITSADFSADRHIRSVEILQYHRSNDT